jgi:hypothetical protein
MGFRVTDREIIIVTENDGEIVKRWDRSFDRNWALGLNKAWYLSGSCFHHTYPLPRTSGYGSHSYKRRRNRGDMVPTMNKRYIPSLVYVHDYPVSAGHSLLHERFHYGRRTGTFPGRNNLPLVIHYNRTDRP